MTEHADDVLGAQAGAVEHAGVQVGAAGEDLLTHQWVIGGGVQQRLAAWTSSLPPTTKALRRSPKSAASAPSAPKDPLRTWTDTPSVARTAGIPAAYE